MKPLFLFLAAPLVLLAACNDDAPADQTSNGGKPAGEVLGGTLSDDMIALDELTSQSPPENGGDEGAAGSAATGATDDTASPSEEAEPEQSDPAPETASQEE